MPDTTSPDSEKTAGSDQDGDTKAHDWPTLAHPQEDIACPPDVVEVALAEALQRASAAGAWETVTALARELEARRKARAEVVDLAQERAKRR